MEVWKIVLLGEEGVGKRALAIQFVLGGFIEDHDPVIDPERQLLVDDRACWVNVSDSVFQEGQGFILLYSTTSRPTLDSIAAFHKAIERVKGRDSVVILAGNKCDQEYERAVRRAEGAELARQLGCEFLETSAKTAQNVERVFTSVVRALRRKEDVGSSAIPNDDGLPKRKRKCIIL
ncbi:ras protein [Mycena leptocephala]|nr:ras protein [Mycena leptocephala]